MTTPNLHWVFLVSNPDLVASDPHGSLKVTTLGKQLRIMKDAQKAVGKALRAELLKLRVWASGVINIVAETSASS